MPNDILGLGKILPIDKLLETISKAVGRVSKPYFDRKDIDTEAYKIKAIAGARAEEMKIISNAVKENFQLTGGIEYKEEKISISSPKELIQDIQQPILISPTVEERTQERVSYQETKKQLNIESITGFATEELKDEQPINNEPLDEDWTTRFFKIAEEISNEEMQALWGKILAGEIKQPKSYSLRTLELIRNLSRIEANTFMKVANFAISTGNTNFIFKGNNDDLLSKNYNVHYGDIALLIEIGLIQPGDFVNFQLLQQATDSQTVFTTGNTIIVSKIKANCPTIQIPINVFSNSGGELLKLIKTTPPFEYLKAFAKSIQRENVEVKYGQILQRDDKNIRHTMPLQDF